MSKRDPVLVKLGESPEAWSDFLWKTYGIAEVPQPKYEDCESEFVCGKTGQTVPLAEIAGRRQVGSHTQQTDELLSLHLESGANANVKLSPAWLLHLEYMDVIAEALSPKDRGAALKQMALTDARSRYWDAPPDVVPASCGTPAEFRQRWGWGELEIRTRAAKRRECVIEIWQHSIPPDQPEDLDLDEAGEPSGHWDGLTWTPGPPEITGS